MSIKNVTVSLLILIVLVPFHPVHPGTWAGEALASPSPSWTEENKAFLNVELLEQLIDLVVENNPTLQSQRKIIAEIESIPIPKRGWEAELTFEGGVGTAVDEDTHTIGVVPSAGLKLEIPLYSPSKQRSTLQQKIAFTKELEQARQRYSDLKNSITSDLFSKIVRLSQLDNEKKNLIKLKSYLSDNLHSLEKQVKAGVIKPDALWVLNERIMNLDTRIYNLSSELNVLKWETAVTLAGQEWRKLLQMLDEICTQILSNILKEV